MKKLSFLLAGLFAVLVACEEKDIVSQNNETPEENNIRVSLVPFYGDSAIATDSTYLTANGELFYMDSLKILARNLLFFDQRDRDTLSPEDEYQIFEPGQMSPLMTRLNGGGFSGKFILILGTDSLMGPGTNQDGELPLPQRIFSNSEFNSNFMPFGTYQFLLYGKVVTSSPTDSIEETEPFSWKVGGPSLADTIYGDNINFSLDNSNTMRLVLTCDIKPVMDNIMIENNKEIKSKPTDFQDFQNAEFIRDNLDFGLF